MSIWHPSMFGFDGPTDCETTDGCNPEQDQVNPLKDLEFDDWWYRGSKYRSSMPDSSNSSNIAVLPAGGTWTVEITCHKAYTSWGSQTTEASSEYDCCPNSPGPYHSHDDSDNLDASQLGGCALGIADVMNPDNASIDGDNPIVIFSVQSKCVWTRETSFSIPEAMPSCSGDFCICSWHWIARQDLPNSYMTGFLCKIDGATSTQRWDTPQDAVWCGDDTSTCLKGAKRPLFAYNNPNNVPWWDSEDPNAKRPGYNTDNGFFDGPQDDIFSTSSDLQNLSASSPTLADTLTESSASPATSSSPSPALSSAFEPSSSSSATPYTTLAVGGSCLLLVVAGLAVLLARRRTTAAQNQHGEEEKALRKGARRRYSSSSDSSNAD
ncbi:hypothetical protein JCM8547_008296 [Rhodosporidiobolus lusitaniae]